MNFGLQSFGLNPLQPVGKMSSIPEPPVWNKKFEKIMRSSIKWTHCLNSDELSVAAFFRDQDWVSFLLPVAPSNLGSVILFTRGKVVLDH